ncbi:MAG: MFS transporter [Acidobacteria bacterium]|nr:MFS transporter [Acidobacteriota bacterium]
MNPDQGLPVADRARRRINRRVMPYLLLLYFVAFLDRTNLSVAALQMKTELGFSDAVVGAGAGIFFIGYFLLEIPGSLIVENWSARKWIARIMISWGIVASLMGLIGTSLFNSISLTNQFYWLRFTLGAAEAGFFPGIIVYLSHWFRAEDRAKAKAHFLIGIPIATIVGVPLSQAIMHNINWFGWPGWRWVFILEGIPSIILGIMTIYILTDRPQYARWLPADEKEWIVNELEKERIAKLASKNATVLQGLMTAFKTPQTYLLASIYFFVVTGYYGLTFFLPSITSLIKGASVTTQTIVTLLPYLCGFLTMLVNGSHSDRTGERKLHTIWSIWLGAIAMTLSILSGDNVALSVTFLCLVGIGVHAYLPVFWIWPSAIMTTSAAATAIGLINSVGNLGGYIGPLIVGRLSASTGSYDSGLWFLAACLLISGLLGLCLRNSWVTRKVAPE